MNRNSPFCPWGDCPNLESGPKSIEHEKRFTNASVGESQVQKNNASMQINSKNTQKHEKAGATES